jgi:gas vesicle protein
MSTQGMKMESKEMCKQMISFNKAAFENYYNTMVAIQDQTEKMIQMFLDQSPLLPKEVKKAIDEWMKAFKKGRENFKGIIEESFKKVESFDFEPLKTQ